jgi:hypothetical protein
LDAPELRVPKAIALYCLDQFLTSTDVTRAGRLDDLSDSIAKLATAHETLLQQQHAERQQQEQAAERTTTVSYLLRCLGSNNAHPDVEFARYVAQCAVIDSRVLSLQLTHCNDDLLRTRLESLFVEKRLVAIRQLLLQQPKAQAVKTKLDAKRISFDDVKSLESAVRLEQNSGIDEGLWIDVGLFFTILCKLRAHNGNAPSELFLSIEAGRVFFPVFFDYDRTKMNQTIFTPEAKG